MKLHCLKHKVMSLVEVHGKFCFKKLDMFSQVHIIQQFNITLHYITYSSTYTITLCDSSVGTNMNNIFKHQQVHKLHMLKHINCFVIIFCTCWCLPKCNCTIIRQSNDIRPTCFDLYRPSSGRYFTGKIIMSNRSQTCNSPVRTTDVKTVLLHPR
jgi:hypothetical protein